MIRPICLMLAAAIFSCVASGETLRLVTLGAAVTQTVAALGDESLIVGRDSSSLLPASVLNRPDVGYFRSVGAEGILALRPTHVVAAVGSGPPEQLDLLRRAGVQVVEPGGAPGLDAYRNLVDRLGALMGRQADARRLLESLDADLFEVSRQVQGRNAPGVVFLLGGATGAQAQVAGRETAAEALLKLAGGRSLGVGHRGYRMLSAEAILALGPDVVVIGTSPASSLPEPEWLRQTKPSVRTLSIPMEDLTFGPGTGQAVRNLAARLHNLDLAADAHGR